MRSMSEEEEEARLFVATPDFWSKYAAKEAPRVVSKLLRDLGVVFIDEADQLVVGPNRGQFLVELLPFASSFQQIYSE